MSYVRPTGRCSDNAFGQNQNCYRIINKICFSPAHPKNSKETTSDMGRQAPEAAASMGRAALSFDENKNMRKVCSNKTTVKLFGQK